MQWETVLDVSAADVNGNVHDMTQGWSCLMDKGRKQKIFVKSNGKSIFSAL